MHELPTHPLRKLASDRKAETEPGLATGVAATLEALEDQLSFLGCDAGTLIADAELRGASVAHLDRDLPAHRAGADRVLEQDPQDPGHAARVCPGPHRPGGVVENRR